MSEIERYRAFMRKVRDFADGKIKSEDVYAASPGVTSAMIITKAERERWAEKSRVVRI